MLRQAPVVQRPIETAAKKADLLRVRGPLPAHGTDPPFLLFLGFVAQIVGRAW